MERPNFDRLSKVLFLDGEPDRVPFYELFADREIMEAVTGEPLLKIDPERARENVKCLLKDMMEKRLIDHDLRVTIKFYFELGYDYTPLSVPSLLSRDNVLAADDTAELPSAKRLWQDENRGVIEDRDEFDMYPWPDLDQIPEFYLPQYEFVKNNIPEGMMIVGGTSGGILENVMWLMGAIPFFKALYRDPFLIRKMFEKIGALISYCSELALN